MIKLNNVIENIYSVNDDSNIVNKWLFIINN
jgi:hypothetical protein